MYSTSVTQYNSYTVHLHINSTDAVKPLQVAAVSAKLFQYVCCNSPVAITTVFCSVTFILLPPISQLYISKAITPLKTSQSVTLDGTPGTIINSCSTTFALLSYIYIYIYIYIVSNSVRGKLSSAFVKGCYSV